MSGAAVVWVGLLVLLVGGVLTAVLLARRRAS
jgi:hypothetical protein